MGQQFDIEPLGGREYLLTAHSAVQRVQTRLQLTEADLDALGVGFADDRRVAEAAAQFLAERQPDLDLPQLLDLNDISLNYPDFAAELQRRLAAATVRNRP